MENPGTIVEKLKNVLEKINSDFNQDNMPEYNKAYDYGDCKVFFWVRGGVLLWKRWCIEFSEDDGHWLMSKRNPNYIAHSWLVSKVECYKAINEWIKENGTPYWYSGNDIYAYEI